MIILMYKIWAVPFGLLGLLAWVLIGLPARSFVAGWNQHRDVILEWWND